MVKCYIYRIMGILGGPPTVALVQRSPLGEPPLWRRRERCILLHYGRGMEDHGTTADIRS